MKYEWRKQEREYYLPKDKPAIVNIPKAKYICIKGKGNPNSEDFSDRISVLYALSYTIKMLPKKHMTPQGYYDYTVYPLEGLWDMSDEAKNKQIFDKNELLYTIMIKQPDFVNEEVFTKALEMAKSKNDNELLDDVYLDEMEDGLSVQMLHKGSYDDESISFEKMKTFINENHLQIRTWRHREIYLSDARKVEKEKLKTVLRYMVSKSNGEDMNNE